MDAASFRKMHGLPPPGQQERSGVVTQAKPQIKLPLLNKMNKGEAAYGQILRAEFPAHDVKFEAIRFRLNAGTYYTVDWSVWKGNTLILCVECKGGWVHKQSSIEKFKQARAEWPHVRFRFAQRRRTEWSIIE